jgi:hypothetical protein
LSCNGVDAGVTGDPIEGYFGERRAVKQLGRFAELVRQGDQRPLIAVAENVAFVPKKSLGPRSLTTAGSKLVRSGGVT